jgi:hypothetical protein
LLSFHNLKGLLAFAEKRFIGSPPGVGRRREQHAFEMQVPCQLGEISDRYCKPRRLSQMRIKGEHPGFDQR